MKASITALLASAVLLPTIGAAASPPPAAAVHHCARALAMQLHVPLGPVFLEPNLGSGLQFAYGERQDQLLLRAHDYLGHTVQPMVCTYDRDNRVVSLRPVSPLDASALAG